VAWHLPLHILGKDGDVVIRLWRDRSYSAQFVGSFRNFAFTPSLILAEHYHGHTFLAQLPSACGNSARSILSLLSQWACGPRIVMKTRARLDASDVSGAIRLRSTGSGAVESVPLSDPEPAFEQMSVRRCSRESGSTRPCLNSFTAGSTVRRQQGCTGSGEHVQNSGNRRT
jgi:hypothetical protein